MTKELNKLEVIELAKKWEEIAKTDNDYYIRRMASITANLLLEMVGESEVMHCPTCRQKMETVDDKEYLTEFGECATCQDLRADFYADRASEATYCDYYEESIARHFI